MRAFVNATMIQESLSSSRRDGQELLPQLIDKLITASIARNKIKQNRIPHGDQIGLSGADGILVVDGETDNQFVPSGISLWEFGTSNDPKTKADDDFGKAEKKLAAAFPAIAPAVTPDKATFVFVTSKAWDSTVWKKGKCRNSTWKEIRIFDAVDLQKWLEQYPVVMLWFAEVCGLPAVGLFDAEQYIRKQGIQFGVELSPELIVAGRDGAKEKIAKLLRQDSQPFRVYGESVDEAAAFLAASVLAKKETLADVHPLVFADRQANLNLLATFNDEIVIVPLDAEALSKVKGLSQPGWRMVTPDIANAETRNKKNDIILEQCNRAALEQHLIENMKVPEHKARQIVRSSKGSLAALLWMLGSGPIAVPRWATRKDATTHASLILAGSWVGDNENDIQIIERLSHKEYRDIETLLQSALLPDGPWISQGKQWLCASKDFVWGQLASKITPTMLEDFLEIVCEVVGEQNPALELDESERYMASILGKVRKYSSRLRKGLVDSLARLAVVRADGQEWANNIVRNLLDPEHSDAVGRWLSLVDVYSELAEAAPGVFLDSLDEMLYQNAALFFPDTSSRNDIFGHTSAHVYLLWALERLAWQHEYFPRVLITLAKLAENAPEAISGNNPHNSLVTILLPWSPQHNEKMEDAAQALEILYRASPDVAWDVAANILPGKTETTSPNPRPEYRGEVNSPQLIGKEYWEFICAVVEKMVIWADSNPRRLAELAEAYPRLQRGWDKVGNIIMIALKEANVSDWKDKEKVIVKYALDSVISRHREYEDADWALPQSILNELDEIRIKYMPVDAVLRCQPYFTWDPNDPESPKERYGDTWDKWLDEKRNQAASEVYKQDGLAGLLRLAEVAELPGCVGQATVTCDLKESEIAELIEATLSISPCEYWAKPYLQFGRGFAFTRFRQLREKWLEGIPKLEDVKWTSEIYANLALSMPVSSEVWKRVHDWGKDAEQLYWQNVEVGFSCLAEWKRVLGKWKEVNRPYSSIQLLAKVIDERHKGKVTKYPSSDQVMDVLDQALNAGDQAEPTRHRGQMRSYYIEKLFAYLDSQETDGNRLAGLEWGYLRVLEGTKRGIRVLYQQVTSSPGLYVDILKMVFRAEDEELCEEPNEDQKIIARQAYHLLHGINKIPGLQTAGGKDGVDAVALHSWVTEVRKLADDAGLLSVCDTQIGEILSYSPESPDGSWPCVEVRSILEEIRSRSIEDGFCVGKYNQRGGVWRGKGGRQEWELVEKYIAYADKVRMEWPHTVSVLEKIASHYKNEALERDKKAEWEEYD